MNDQRWVVLGLANVRSPWFRQVTGWAMSGVLPIDFVKCVSTEEVAARLRSGRRHSAVVLDGSLGGVDRDLLAVAAANGAAAFVVSAPTAPRDWAALGAIAELQPDFARTDLLDLLRLHAEPLLAQATVAPPAPEPSAPDGRLIAVIGRTGGGVSSVATALAQGLADQPRHGDRVLLADFARSGDQALLHDAHDVVPGLQELVEAHRLGRPPATETRSMTFNVPERGYDLLLGLRRSRDWVALRPSSVESTLESLRCAYNVVVADIDADLEGADGGGSIDVEERNFPARHIAESADVAVAVGTAGLVGVRALVTLIDELTSLGVSPARIQPVINRGPTRQRERADLAKTIADLLVSDERLLLPTPIHLPDRRNLDDVHRNGTRLPAQMVSPLIGAVDAALARTGDTPRDLVERPPELIAPGSLGVAPAEDEPL